MAAPTLVARLAASKPVTSGSKASGTAAKSCGPSGGIHSASSGDMRAMAAARSTTVTIDASSVWLADALACLLPNATVTPISVSCTSPFVVGSFLAKRVFAVHPSHTLTLTSASG